MKNRRLIEQHTTVTVRELSSLLGITTRYVRKLALKAVVSRTGRNKYHLQESVRGYIRHREALAREQGRKSAFCFDLSTLDLPGAEEQASTDDITLNLSGWER